MSLFTKTNIASTRGIQKTKWDDLLPEFVNPGDTLEFNDTVSGPTASQCAKRLSTLDGKRKFHSFYNTLTKKYSVRVRPEGEIPDKDAEEDTQKK